MPTLAEIRMVPTVKAPAPVRTPTRLPKEMLAASLMELERIVFSSMEVKTPRREAPITLEASTAIAQIIQERLTRIAVTMIFGRVFLIP